MDSWERQCAHARGRCEAHTRLSLPLPLKIGAQRVLDMAEALRLNYAEHSKASSSPQYIREVESANAAIQQKLRSTVLSGGEVRAAWAGGGER